MLSEASSVAVAIVYDGGGIRGIVQAVFTQLVEALLGNSLASVVDLLVGTSIGGAGCIALATSSTPGEGPTNALVLLEELRQRFAAGHARRSGLYDILPLVQGSMLEVLGISRDTSEYCQSNPRRTLRPVDSLLTCYRRSTVLVCAELSDLPPVPGQRPRIVLVTATAKDVCTEPPVYVPYFLTNFETPDNFNDEYSMDWPVWKVTSRLQPCPAHCTPHTSLIRTQAVQATSAAKTYFPEVEHEGRNFVDGAFAYNNPSEPALCLANVLRCGD